jgi:hypothetical protein
VGCTGVPPVYSPHARTVAPVVVREFGLDLVVVGAASCFVVMLSVLKTPGQGAGLFLRLSRSQGRELAIIHRVPVGDRGSLVRETSRYCSNSTRDSTRWLRSKTLIQTIQSCRSKLRSRLAHGWAPADLASAAMSLIRRTVEVISSANSLRSLDSSGVVGSSRPR